jgi:hypothetical protein
MGKIYPYITTSINILPTEGFYEFLITLKIIIIFLNNINNYVFLMEAFYSVRWIINF